MINHKEIRLCLFIIIIGVVLGMKKTVMGGLQFDDSRVSELNKSVNGVLSHAKSSKNTVDYENMTREAKDQHLAKIFALGENTSDINQTILSDMSFDSNAMKEVLSGSEFPDLIDTSKFNEVELTYLCNRPVTSLFTKKMPSSCLSFIDYVNTHIVKIHPNSVFTIANRNRNSEEDVFFNVKEEESEKM